MIKYIEKNIRKYFLKNGKKYIRKKILKDIYLKILEYSRNKFDNIKGEMVGIKEVIKKGRKKRKKKKIRFFPKDLAKGVS